MHAFLHPTHRFYCSVDPHARTMYLCILDADGQVVFDRNLPATGQAFLTCLVPLRADTPNENSLVPQTRKSPQRIAGDAS